MCNFKCLTTAFCRYFLFNVNVMYRNDPKFSDRYVKANSAVPDQTAPLGSGSSLFAIPFAYF